MTAFAGVCLTGGRDAISIPSPHSVSLTASGPREEDGDDVCCDRRPFHCSSEGSVRRRGEIRPPTSLRGSPATPEIKSNSPSGRSAGCRSGLGRRDRRHHHGHGAGDFQMEQSGVIAAGSRADLGRTLTGIRVRADTPMPDISTPDGFKQTLLKARSVAYTNPQAGGTSGIFLVGLLERLGIAEAVARRPCSASMATRSSTRFPRATPRSARPSSARSCR